MILNSFLLLHPSLAMWPAGGQDSRTHGDWNGVEAEPNQKAGDEASWEAKWQHAVGICQRQEAEIRTLQVAGYLPPCPAPLPCSHSRSRTPGAAHVLTVLSPCRRVDARLQAAAG